MSAVVLRQQNDDYQRQGLVPLPKLLPLAQQIGKLLNQGTWQPRYCSW